MATYEKVSDCKPCCKYAGTIDGQPCCDYILITDRKRPCPGGPDCTEWTPAAPGTKKPQPITISNKRGGRRRTWDTALARKLYDEGASQSQIATACGTTPPAVALWQKEENLVPNGIKNAKLKAQKKAQKPAAAPESAAPVAPDAAIKLPVTEVEMTITFGGVSVSVKAGTVRDALDVLNNPQEILTAVFRGIET